MSSATRYKQLPDERTPIAARRSTVNITCPKCHYTGRPRIIRSAYLGHRGSKGKRVERSLRVCSMCRTLLPRRRP